MRRHRRLDGHGVRDRALGRIVGAVGAPHDVEVPIETVIFRNVGLRGGVAPARKYLPELLAAVLAGDQPGTRLRLRDRPRPLVDGYEAMDDRRAIKSLVRVARQPEWEETRPQSCRKTEARTASRKPGRRCLDGYTCPPGSSATR